MTLLPSWIGTHKDSKTKAPLMCPRVELVDVFVISDIESFGCKFKKKKTTEIIHFGSK